MLLGLFETKTEILSSNSVSYHTVLGLNVRADDADDSFWWQKSTSKNLLTVVQFLLKDHFVFSETITSDALWIFDKAMENRYFR